MTTTPIRLGIVTLSDKGSRGERIDTSGPAIAEVLAPLLPDVRRRALLPDERAELAALLCAWSDAGDLDLIVTTGGTGFAPRDVTPEATRDAIEREAPGLAELMRAAGLRHTPMAALSRAVAGVRGRTLIVNLPGSEKGVRESLEAVRPLLSHIVETLRGEGGDHITTATGVRPA